METWLSGSVEMPSQGFELAISCTVLKSMAEFGFVFNLLSL